MSMNPGWNVEADPPFGQGVGGGPGQACRASSRRSKRSARRHLICVSNGAGDSGDHPRYSRERRKGQMPTDDASEVSEVRLVAAYQALSAKWIASRALLWQFPALTLTAQAFLIGAATQLKDASFPVRILMAVSIAVVGIASIAIQFRVGREAHLDLVMLDRYESVLLANRPDLLSHHSTTMFEREALVTGELLGRASEQLFVDISVARTMARHKAPRECHLGDHAGVRDGSRGAHQHCGLVQRSPIGVPLVARRSPPYTFFRFPYCHPILRSCRQVRAHDATKVLSRSPDATKTSISYLPTADSSSPRRRTPSIRSRRRARPSLGSASESNLATDSPATRISSRSRPRHVS